MTRKSSNKDFAFVKCESKIIKINFQDILFIEAFSDYVKINTIGSEYVILSTMKSIQAFLPKDDFFRVHRSFLVRKDKITIIENNMILMEKKNIPISRSAKRNLLNSLNFF